MNTREGWIDYLKGLGIILMIIGHTSINQPFIKWIYGFHMPLFYMLSGYLFNRGKWFAKDYGSFLKARAKSYLVSYLIWCIICFVINIPYMYLKYKDDHLLLRIVQNFGWILTSVRIDDVFLPQKSTPLWFLTSIFVSQASFYLIVKCRPVLQIIICTCIITANHFIAASELPILPWHFETSVLCSVFMLIGYYIRGYGLLEKVKSEFLCEALIVISSIMILLNDRIDIYYRKYGNILVFIIAVSLMIYSVMWLHKNRNFYIFKDMVIRLGSYSVIPIGLNYSINIYTRNIVKTITGKSGSEILWLEYLLPAINLVIIFGAIYVFMRLVKKNRKWSVLIGR